MNINYGVKPKDECSFQNSGSNTPLDAGRVNVAAEFSGYSVSVKDLVKRYEIPSIHDRPTLTKRLKQASVTLPAEPDRNNTDIDPVSEPVMPTGVTPLEPPSGSSTSDSEYEYVDEDEEYTILQHPLEMLKGEVPEELAVNEKLVHSVAYNLEGLSGTQVVVSDDSGAEKRSYSVVKVEGSSVHSGLNPYILYPEETAGNGESVDIKLLFRGTKDVPSIIRDLDTDGAGQNSLIKATGCIDQKLMEVIKALHLKHPDKSVTLTIGGHSLGGADAQNYATHFLTQLATISNVPGDQSPGDEKDNPLLKRIKSAQYPLEFLKVGHLHLFTKCSAGTSIEMNDCFKRALQSLEGRIDRGHLSVELTCLKVDKDLVSSTGECHIGFDVDPKLASIHVAKIIPAREDSRIKRHCGKFCFTEGVQKKNRCKVADYTSANNQSHTGKKEVKRSLNNTSLTLRNPVIKAVQSAVHYVGNAALSLQ